QLLPFPRSLKRKKRSQPETNPSRRRPPPDPAGVMALRVPARKLRFPAIAALQRSPYPGVPPASSSRHLTSRSSQNGGSRAANGTRKARSISMELRKAEKELLRGMAEDRRNHEELMIAIDNLPRNIVLTCTAGIAVLTSGWAYLCGAFDGNRVSYGDRERSA
ncbi:unnamed protein product, partial [Urochloa humidicola]